METKNHFGKKVTDTAALGSQYRIFTESIDLIYDEATGRHALRSTPP